MPKSITMMRIRSFIFVFLLFLLAVPSGAQVRYYLEHYGVEEGLPQHTVMDMLQDHKGFMWFATWNGICKFDGENFYSYRIQSEDSHHMRSNRIDFLEEDKYGFIWLLPYDGEPCRFDPRTERFISLRDITGNEEESVLTKKIITTPSGKVWLLKADIGLICVTDKRFNLKRMNSEDVIYTVHEDQERNSWILTNNGVYVETEDGAQTNSFFVNRTNNNLSGFYALMEYEDEIWIGSDNGEIQVYNKHDKHFGLIKLKTQAKIKDIKNINDKLVLVSSEDDGFFIYNRTKSKAEHFNTSNLAEMKNNSILYSYIDRSGNIWFELDHSGVAKFNLKKRLMRHFEAKNEGKVTNILPPVFIILEDHANRIWVHPTGGGFSYYDPKQDALIPFLNEPNSKSWHFSSMLHAAFMDIQGNLWLSTRSQGLEKIVFPDDVFNVTLVAPDDHFPEDNDVRCIFEDHLQNLWVSTKADKLFVYNPSGKQLGYLCKDGTIGSGEEIGGAVYTIMQDKDLNLWVGTKGKGIYKLSAKKGEIRKYDVTHYKHDPHNDYSLSSDNIYSIFQDVRDQIWVGTFNRGVNLVCEDQQGSVKFVNCNNEIPQYPIQTGAKVRVISADKFGNICVGTTFGLIVFSSDFTNPSDIQFKSYIRKPKDNSGVSANDIFDIQTTAKGETFLATVGGGLNKIAKTDEKGFPLEFKYYTTRSGLPSDVVVTLIEDTEGKLWVTTELSLTKFDAEKEYFETFSEIRRLLHRTSFSEGARFSSKSGVLYLGTSNGFLSVKTNKIVKNDFNPYVAFTNLLISNQKVPIDETSFLSKNIDDMEELRLSHKQNFFSIEFATLDYSNPQNISYSYKLDGFDDDWIMLNKQQTANYTNMEAGKYVFRVKSTNSDGVWMDNEHALPIIITPPIWNTGWAYVLYFVVIASLVYFILRGLFMYLRLRDKVNLEHEQTEMKTRFFMDVSHEIRTPLTMIISPLENVIEGEDVSQGVKTQLKLVLKNANRMLRMVNQVLDFRKIQKQKVNLQELPIATMVWDVCNNFLETAESKDIKLEFINNVGDATLWADVDGVEKLVFNLLSNAFKHSVVGKKIEVSLSYDKKGLRLAVKDEGAGMSKEILDKLFTRFSSFTLDKSKPSTGIGLSIVKEVVEKHHARIVVESELGKGSCFAVYFKMGTEHFKDDDITFTYSPAQHGSGDIVEVKDKISVSQAEDEQEEMPEDNPVILVVEDDDDLRSFIKEILSSHYSVLEASNGLEGYNIAITDQPDFIISDIMMDKLDGIGFLKRVRDNSETSHIPFILLTAKTNIETKVQGLEYGADDYITKPFSVKYLKAKIENIIAQRKQLYEAYTDKDYSQHVKEDKEKNATPSITSLDEEFILKMKKEIEQNIDNSEYVVNDLAIAMAMSRTVFYKKVKSLTGFSPIEFIRDIKIKHAAQLLESEEYSIKEVSYMIGISDTKYFTQCFKKKYGMTPSEYRSKEE